MSGPSSVRPFSWSMTSGKWLLTILTAGSFQEKGSATGQGGDTPLAHFCLPPGTVPGGHFSSCSRGLFLPVLALACEPGLERLGLGGGQLDGGAGPGGQLLRVSGLHAGSDHVADQLARLAEPHVGPAAA